jgi:hypothetical protein
MYKNIKNFKNLHKKKRESQKYKIKRDILKRLIQNRQTSLVKHLKK